MTHTGQLHGLCNGGRATVQRTPEDVGEAQHVVDLIGVVRTPCGNDDVGSRGARQLRTDLGLWVGECQNHRVTRHAFNHVYCQHTRCRATQENICAVDHVSQRAGVCFLGVAGFGFIVAARATFIDHAFGIAHKNIGCRYAQAHHHVEASNRSGTGAGHSDLYFANRLVHQLQSVEQRGCRDDGCAVLIVMEDGNFHALTQLLFDVEALGRFDVFKVDAAQCRFECSDDVDQLVGIALGQFDIEYIDTGEFFKQATFALHHWFTGEWPDVAQPQNCCAVGHDADQVATRGVLGRHGRVFLDRQARVGHAG